MKKKWIFIAVIVGILLLAAFRYSLVEESEQLPDKVRLGSLLGSEALAETEEPDTEEETGAAVGLLPAAGLNPEDESSAPAQTTSAPSPEEAVTEPAGAEQPAQDIAQPEEEPEEAAPTAEEEPAPRLKRGDSGREVKALQQHLKKLGYNLTYTESPGDHQWKYWDEHIQDVLNWLVK